MRGYKAHKRSRCPANYSHCFKKCGKLGKFKKAGRSRTVKSIEEAADIFSIAFGNITSNNLLRKIHNEFLSDHVCSQVIIFCQNGWLVQARVGHDLHPYFQVRNNILFQKELLLKCNRIVIPKILQKEILNNIHEGHQGITKCHARAQSLSRDIEPL